MSRFTIFVGGVHGVGKGSVCQTISNSIVCDYISMSSLLGWKKVAKEVEDVGANQETLSVLLPYVLRDDKVFLLDGHFALLGEKGTIETVPLKFFEACKPDVLIVLMEDPAVIAERLKKRDDKEYSIEQLEQLQTIELSNAETISELLKIKLFVVKSTDKDQVQSIIREIKDSLAREYTRESIYSKMLKTVIIRFDYSGVTDLTRFVDEIKRTDLITNAFGRLQKLEQRQFGLSVKPEEIEAGSLPTTQRQISTIFRFSDCKYNEGLDVIMDVGSDYTCLTIDCRANYNGSKAYTDLVAKLIIQLKKFDSFVLVGRIGIRKIDIQVIEDGERLEDYFNGNFLAIESWNKAYKDKVNLTEFFRIGRVNFNVVHHIDRIANGRPRAVFDVDAYVVNEDLETLLVDEKSLIGFLNDEMQNKMFDLFVSSVSKEYLEKCKIAKLSQ